MDPFWMGVLATLAMEGGFFAVVLMTGLAIVTIRIWIS